MPAQLRRVCKASMTLRQGRARLRASAGQSRNQSMVQQLTRAGNWRQRCLKAAPTGFMHSTMCRCVLTWATKAAHRRSSVSAPPCREQQHPAVWRCPEQQEGTSQQTTSSFLLPTTHARSVSARLRDKVVCLCLDCNNHILLGHLGADVFAGRTDELLALILSKHACTSSGDHQLHKKRTVNMFCSTLTKPTWISIRAKPSSEKQTGRDRQPAAGGAS